MLAARSGASYSGRAVTPPLPFCKVEGAGNDYVLVDEFARVVSAPGALARAMADRHRGIGSDGLILVGPPREPGADARMRMYNADGSEGLMCGNGLRCVVRWLVEHGHAPGPRVRVETAAGLRVGELLGDGRVRLAMGEPRFAPEALPVRAAPRADGGPARVALPAALPALDRDAYCVSVGNPHVVVRVEDPGALDLAAYGRALQDGGAFPEGVNVHLVGTPRAGVFPARPYERGSGATRACGTGAVAVAAVARRLGWTHADRVRVAMPGGELEIDWPGHGEAALIGPAQLVFEGVWSRT